MFTDFYDAWYFLTHHEIYVDEHYVSYFTDSLHINVVKVNPKTEEIDENEELNTVVRIWLETGPYEKDRFRHDIDLDCGGPTFEEAIINLANLVQEKYGNNVIDF